MKKARNYYIEIDNILKAFEGNGYTAQSMYWVTDRIAWCWKFRKITEEQMEELANRATYIFENKLCDYFGHKI